MENKNQICPVCKKHGVRKGCYNRCDQNNTPKDEGKCECKSIKKWGIIDMSYCSIHNPTPTVQEEVKCAHQAGTTQNGRKICVCGQDVTPTMKIEHCSEPDCPECNKAAYEAGRQAERKVLREQIEKMESGNCAECIYAGNDNIDREKVLDLLASDELKG